MACEYCDREKQETLAHDRFASDAAPDILHYEGLGSGPGEAVLAVIIEGIALYIPANYCLNCGAELR